MHPYVDRDERHFWKPAVAQRAPGQLSDLWRPRIAITRETPIATFGSCFAQHMGRTLRQRGFNWRNYEPAPGALSEREGLIFNYGVFSARTGNIYTATLLEQWIAWALGDQTAPAEAWNRTGRIIDPFRPRIEREEFGSLDEMRLSRDLCLEALRRCVSDCKLLIFTLGLTESWRHRNGYEYPMCPGTIAGTFDADIHHFVNLDHDAVVASLSRTIARLRSLSPSLQFLLTVSPVPIAATASDDHVLVAAMQAKSVLRAAAASTVSRHDGVDYFPSYELVASPVFEGRSFAANKRDVTEEGVAFVMEHFFAGLGLGGTEADVPQTRPPPSPDDEDQCEEALLAAFSPVQRSP